jgi:surface protein
MSQDCDKPVAGKKLKRRVSVAPVEDTKVPYDSTDRWTGMNSNLTSMDAPSQYQRLKLIQNTVRVDASSYSMNRGALNVYETRPDNIATVGWNQMSDRTQPHEQVERMSMKSSVSIRPGNMSPGGIGCDIKHNSYERYLARLKAAGPLRKENLSINYGKSIIFNPANPIYGGKTVKTSIGTSLCACGPLLGPFVQLFTYTFDVVAPGITKQQLNEADFNSYIPIISNNALLYTSTVTVINTSVSVSVQYFFNDDGSTADGISFNISGLVNFYNTYTRNLKITTFGGIPLSRGGSQFKGLRDLPTFPDDPIDIPAILETTSLSRCFQGVSNFNGLHDTIMTILRTELIIDTSYMFYQSDFNIEDLTLDITYIDNLEGMFQETSVFNPSNVDINIRKLTPDPVLYEYEKSTLVKATPRPKPKPKKIVKSLFNKAKAFTGNPIFKYFNANAQIVGFSRMQQTQEGEEGYAETEPFMTPVMPDIVEDISSMFYECINFNPIGEFSLIAAPIKMDYVFFNASQFNAPLDTSYNKLDMRFTETIDYAFSGATKFEQPLITWDLQSLTSSVNVFSGSAIPQNVVPNYFAFEYTFVYEGTFPINILNYLPVIQSGALVVNPPTVTETPIYAPNGTTVIKMEYLISFNYLFTDDGTTHDGISFINVVNFYNANVPSGVTINRFGGLHLSRNGYQFAGLTVPLTFFIPIVPSVPSILTNTSLNNCFYNSPNFNSDISYWITTNVRDMSSMFQNATTFNQDIRAWDVNNVVYFQNFANNSGQLKPPTFISRAGFIYSFTYTGFDETLVNYENYIPIINNDSNFTITSTKITTTLAKLVTLQIEFTFSDNGITKDGLSFINVSDFYNQLTLGLTILQYGNIPLSRDGFQFANVTTINITAVDTPTVLPNTSFSGFIATSGFNSNINNWNIPSIITNFNYMFWYGYLFNQDLSGWDTSNVTNMDYMFENAASFNYNLSRWRVGNVISHINFATGSKITGLPNFPS